ncbi:methyl-accepting chemotaxis protein [Marinobacterium zhoushanense]|uniref:Methyl-accepting chemotaxis protein n=1 Tax=Marinobacterium zhoushanense TaxID=1679163 RepID=A0ABQ1KRH5_9GAMM|nr:methyl-accepting chemotaxis protein [Marinobacterium zhoushanense]GGC05556.1 methyl-accepting chemotaxis protein [Marinobacterium zhoushanense]
MAIRTRLLLSIIAIAVIPLIIASALITWSTEQQVDAALRQTLTDRLVAIREMKKTQLQDEFETLRQITVSIASRTETLRALSDFSRSFNAAAQPDSELNASLDRFYRGALLKRMRASSPQTAAQSIDRMLGALDGATREYQARYISLNPNPLGAKQLLMQADNSHQFDDRYDLYHGLYHPQLLKLQQQFGFYDLMLVDPDGRVIYSVLKEIAFATSLQQGPFADSLLAESWRQSRDTEPGNVNMTDMAPFAPSYGKPALFMSTPVDSDGERLGSLIVQIPGDRISRVLTSGERWQDVGMGQSGEALLVGQDRRLRSQSRLLQEDPQEYFAKLDLQGNQDRLETIRNLSTAISLQKVDSGAVRKALAGESGVEFDMGYYGTPVISAYTPINLMGRSWVLLSEISQREAFAEKELMIRSLTHTSAVTVLVTLVIAIVAGLAIARVLTHPLRILVDRLREIARGDGDLSVQLQSANRKDEIGELSRAFNDFVGKIRALVVAVSGTGQQLTALASDLHLTTDATDRHMASQREQSRSIASAMTEFAASINEVASSSRETLDTMGRADEASLLGAECAHSSAAEIADLVKQTQASAASITQLSDDIGQISKVLEVIDGIAEQTSLLSLNAAIEAARAGEQGRGFAVVADEVRALSSRTQDATIDIQQMIERLRRSAQDAVMRSADTVERANRSIANTTRTADELAQIRELVTEIKGMHSQITAAVTQQQSTVGMMETSIVAIDSLSDVTLQGARDASERAEHLRTLANQLGELVGRFRTG